MDEVVDGQYQKYTVEPGQLHPRATSSASIPSCSSWSNDYSDEQLAKLRRGGHDPEKVYAAYKAAVETVEAARR